MVNVASELSTRNPVLNAATHAILAPISKYNYNNCYYVVRDRDIITYRNTETHGQHGVSAP